MKVKGSYRLCVDAEVSLCLFPVGPILLMFLEPQPDYHSNMGRDFWKVFKVHLFLSWVLNRQQRKHRKQLQHEL